MFPSGGDVRLGKCLGKRRKNPVTAPVFRVTGPEFLGNQHASRGYRRAKDNTEQPLPVAHCAL